MPCTLALPDHHFCLSFMAHCSVLRFLEICLPMKSTEAIIDMLDICSNRACYTRISHLTYQPKCAGKMADF